MVKVKLWKTCQQKGRQQTKTKEASNLKVLRNTIYFKFHLYQSNSLNYKILLNICSNGKIASEKFFLYVMVRYAKQCDKKS